MEQFGNIGKAILTRALGLQKNYQEVIESYQEIIDKDATGCYDCKWEQVKTVFGESEALVEEACRHCESCPKKRMKKEAVYKKIYHNEKNQFGYQPRLKTNAIKLLLLYHMQSVDKYGIVRAVDTRQMADLIGCDEKTIVNNNKHLEEYGYISFCSTGPHTINLLLPNYKDYFLPASAGGRGFLVLSAHLLEGILKIQSLNELRLSLRQLMELDYLNARGVEKSEKSYREIRQLLPDYCKRGVIKKTASKLQMFDVTLSDRFVCFQIKPEYDSKKVKEETRALYEKSLSSFTQKLNDQIIAVNNEPDSSIDTKFEEFFAKEPEGPLYPLFRVTELDLYDLSGLCLQYSFHEVITAMASAYATYYIKDTVPDNLGGLIRHLIQIKFQKAA